MNNTILPIMLVDDEAKVSQGFTRTLHRHGIKNIITCADSRRVMDILAKEKIELMLLDLSMPYIDGLQILTMVKASFPDIPVIIVTGTSKIETAVYCMKLGGYDYLVKPVEPDALIKAIDHALEFRRMQRENDSLKKCFFSDRLECPEAFAAIVTQNKAMYSVFKYIEAVAPSMQPILITGETGVGKELVARSIHTLSSRKGKFVAVNVAGLDDNVVSDTLFGHVKGAFTGAEKDRAGLIEKTKNGTLFLDEIGDLTSPLQVKLLRLIQEKEYFMLGSDEVRLSNSRIITATHQNLESLEKAGKFRKDLYYRLNVHHIHIPPLKERLDDLPILVEHFLQKAADSLNKKKPTLPEELLVLLSSYNFPGNIRELESMILDAVSQHTNKILSLAPFKSHLQKKGNSLLKSQIAQDSSQFFLFFPEHLPTLKQTSNLLVEEALKRAGGNQAIAAQLLGISQQALSKRLKQKKS